MIVRDDEILLSRVAPYLAQRETWTLPGGGVEFGEHPRDAVIREVHEETGLHATVGDVAWVDSALRVVDRDHESRGTRMHAVRMVFEGWVPKDSPQPHVIEVDGSTVDARWHRVDDVVSGSVPTTTVVRQAMAAIEPARHQRLAAYALVRRDDDVLLTRISRQGFHVGSWTLPGGGVGHGESPADALRREVREEAGVDVEVGDLLGVHDVHFSGTAPDGRFEDFHGVHLVFAGTVPADAEPRVVEADGTTDAVSWVPLRQVHSGDIEVLDVVTEALALSP